MDSNWQQQFFRGVALEMWRRATTQLNPSMTIEEVDFLERTLHLQPGADVLDIPCGNGRHAIALARRGYHLTGVDLSEEFIAEARASGVEHARWVQADMRTLDESEQFDAAYCFCNSFAYFSPREAAEFLCSIARTLRPGGRFVLDTGMVAESLLPSFQQKRWYRLGDLLMLSENRYDPTESRLDIDYTFVHNGVEETRPTSSYLFTSGELGRMHSAAGLQPTEWFGGINCEPYRMGSPRLLLVSTKR